MSSHPPYPNFEYIILGQQYVEEKKENQILENKWNMQCVEETHVSVIILQVLIFNWITHDRSKWLMLME